mmetsp:Transcript_28623/g.82542  ORF Transcript_28623/g.82542 Transcript_28623/m.82542 type:complete len:114 (-) Transcript_28623:473-814(-)
MDGIYWVDDMIASSFGCAGLMLRLVGLNCLGRTLARPSRQCIPCIFVSVFLRGWQRARIQQCDDRCFLFVCEAPFVTPLDKLPHATHQQLKADTHRHTHAREEYPMGTNVCSH